jgi:hypothetical protein
MGHVGMHTPVLVQQVTYGQLKLDTCCTKKTMLTNHTLKQQITAASHDGGRESIQSIQTDVKDRP